MRTPTCLYRFYNQRGKLLYAGISLGALTRLAHHRFSAEWFTEVESAKFEHFTTRRSALRAEAEAIRTERPIHNRTHIPRFSRPIIYIPESLLIKSLGKNQILFCRNNRIPYRNFKIRLKNWLKSGGGKAAR